MATKAFHIELRVSNVDDPERMDALTKALQRAGRQLHSDAMLIVGDTPAPEVMLYGEDFADGRTDISTKDED